jgi:hypothetical protein
VKLSELKKNFAPAAAHSQKLTPDTAKIFSQLAHQTQKTKTNLADLEAFLEILQS